MKAILVMRTASISNINHWKEFAQTSKARAMTDRITIRRPDDWHLHFRDGGIMREVVPFTARQFARAIVMPNLSPPVTDTASAAAYRARIQAAVPSGADFTPLMTCYLTDDTDPDDLARGASEGVFTAAKLYPANATTNSKGTIRARHVERIICLAVMQPFPVLDDEAISIYPSRSVRLSALSIVCC